MYNIFLEATDNIRVMHEIETILDNDDIPARSRSHFLSLLTIACTKKLSPKQTENVKVFRELFVRIDKDTRTFRTFLNLAVDLAAHYKFENSPLVYAFKNVSLEDHFLNFVDFAKRRNPVIDRNNPLQLFLTLGISIIKLALSQNQLEMRQNEVANNKKLLLNQYSELSREMSERFINMDFGSDMMANQDDYTDILDDSDEYDNAPSSTQTCVAQIHATQSPMASPRPHKRAGEYNDNEVFLTSSVSTSLEDISKSETQNGFLDPILEDAPDNMSSDDDDIVEIMGNILDDDQYSGISKDTVEATTMTTSKNNDILKSLKNGDKELNLQHLDTLVMEAGRKFGPAVIGAITRSAEEDRSPTIRFNNHSVKNIVDFINH